MFEAIIEFLVNKQIKFTHKSITIILIIIGVLMVDNIIGFSHYYNSEAKLTQFELISNLKKDTNLSIESKQSINEIEESISQRKSIKDKIYLFVSSIKLTKDTNTNKANVYEDTVPRNNLLLFVLSSWLLIIMTFLVLPIALIAAPKSQDYKTRDFFYSIITGLILFGIFAFSTYFLVGLIPMIGDSWIINYIIAFIFQPTIIGIICIIYYKLRKK